VTSSGTDRAGAGRSPFDPFDGAPATTRRVVRTERLRLPLVAGAVLGAIGLIAALVGAAILYLAQSAEVLAAVGRADVGESIVFDADDGSHALVFMPSIPAHDGYRRTAMSNLVCDIVGPDGSTQTVRGSRQETAIVTDFGWSIGSFVATGGATEVRCSFARDPGGDLRMYAVAPERSGSKSIGSMLITSGFVVALIGAALIAYGWRGRSIVEHLPIDPPT
jgi:hypothetical protein